MRKLFLVFIFVFGAFCSGHAQELGLRFGDVSGGNVAVDAIWSTGKFNRLHGNVSFGNGVGVDALWDFLYRPVGGEAFNWYVGAGPYTFIGDHFALGAVGEIGLEYRFNGIPLAIGGDWRPALRLIEDTDVVWHGFGFNVRYVFNKTKE